MLACLGLELYRNLNFVESYMIFFKVYPLSILQKPINQFIMAHMTIHIR